MTVKANESIETLGNNITDIKKSEFERIRRISDIENRISLLEIAANNSKIMSDIVDVEALSNIRKFSVLAERVSDIASDVKLIQESVSRVLHCANTHNYSSLDYF